jgi:hypothetical protein
VAVVDASRLATILEVMRQCLEASELEQRISEMEGGRTSGGSRGSTKSAKRVRPASRFGLPTLELLLSSPKVSQLVNRHPDRRERERLKLLVQQLF